MGVHIEIPDFVAISDLEVKMTLAAKLFDRGLITSGQGAEIVGVSKQTFIELLGKFDVSVFQYDIEDILRDVEQA